MTKLIKKLTKKIINKLKKKKQFPKGMSKEIARLGTKQKRKAKEI